jgi:glycosyltransferase involved in cell wall biosynthesis
MPGVRERMRPPAGAASECPVSASARVGAPAREVTIVAQDIGGARGMERVLSELVLGLVRIGYRVTVVARTCELPDLSGVAFRRVRGPARPFLIAYPWFVLAATLTLRRWRRGVVHVTGGIVLNRVDIIAVHYCHQVAVATPSRSNWVFRAHNTLAGMLKRFGERACFRASRASAFVCVSEGVADEIRMHYPQLVDRVLTIHNGVDTDTFAPDAHRAPAHELRAQLGIEDTRLVAVFVGGEWKRKGLRHAIDALALAPEWDLLVAGGGYEKDYQQIADSIGVGDAVHWMGSVREVQVVYQMADAFVLPSSYETFSLVTFEAAASGLAVLATPVNGVRELIEDAHNGFLITQEPDMIAARLRDLGADPELRARLGRAARQSALEFSWASMVGKHQRLYARLAGETD